MPRIIRGRSGRLAEIVCSIFPALVSQTLIGPRLVPMNRMIYNQLVTGAVAKKHLAPSAVRYHHETLSDGKEFRYLKVSPSQKEISTDVLSTKRGAFLSLEVTSVFPFALQMAARTGFPSPCKTAICLPVRRSQIAGGRLILSSLRRES